MKKGIVFLFTVILFAGISWGDGSAQILNENHYLVYEAQDFQLMPFPVQLSDQFYEFLWTDVLFLDKFANPVTKNGLDPQYTDIHQTWWAIDEPHMDVYTVKFYNQFLEQADQIWHIKDARYLILPAWKNLLPPPNEPPEWNHYKCYEVIGVQGIEGPPPPMNINVSLSDQFLTFDAVVMEPELFCAPCTKTLENGESYGPLDNRPHLAVYNIDRQMFWGKEVFTHDQFLLEYIIPEFTEWLVVPSDKLSAVATEENTWGGVKSLYRD